MEDRGMDGAGDKSAFSQTAILPSYSALKKSTLGEVYSQLNQLVKGKSAGDFKNINEVLSPIGNLPLFDQSLQLILIDSLRIKDEVVKILLSEDDYHIKRILKCNWFFEDSLTAEYYSKEIFPKVSGSLRCKIITKLSKNLKSTKEAEKLVGFILKDYSCQNAEWLLPRCSEEFIKDYLTQYNPSFRYNNSPRVLLNICRCYPNLGGKILSDMFESDQGCDTQKFKKALMYMAFNHPDFFISIFKKHPIKFSYHYFGRRFCKRLGPKMYDFILQSREIIKWNIIKEEILCQSLCLEDKLRLFEAIVRFHNQKLSFSNWTSVTSTMARLLKKINPLHRLYVIETTFKRVYNAKFEDHHKCWTVDILELFLVEERQRFAAELEKYVTEKYEQGSLQSVFTDQENICYLYEWTTAFEKLKKLLYKASTVQKRQTVLEKMVESCFINHSTEGLQQLIEFVTSRHRNDDPHLIFSVFLRIIDMFSRSDLNLPMLEKMEELAYFLAVKGHSSSNYNRILELVIFHRLQNNLEVGDYVKKVFRFSILKRGYSTNFISDFKSPHSRKLIFAYCAEILNWIRSNSPDVNTSEMLLSCICFTIQDYNEVNKDRKISLEEVEGLAEGLKPVVKRHHEKIGGEDLGLDIWQKYSQNISSSYQEFNFFLYIAKHKPEAFVKNLSKICEHFILYCFSASRDFWQLKRFFSFEGVLDEVKNILLIAFKTRKSIAERKKAIQMYSHIADVGEFQAAIAEYMPKSEHIDQKTDSDFSEMQLFIPQILMNLRPRCRSLSLVMKLLFGEYYKNARKSLYTCCFHTQVDVVLPMLKSYFNSLSRVSPQKDAIRLIVELSTNHDKINFCLDVWKRNQHHSIRTILMMYIGKLFLEQPSRAFSTLTKFISESDDVVIASRPSLQHVPTAYLNDYTVSLWEFSARADPQTKNSIQSSILNFFTRKKIHLLSRNFCEEIIRSYLFKQSRSNVELFAVNYVMSDEKEIKPRSLMLVDLLKEALNDSQSVTDFLHCLCLSAMQDAKYSGIVDTFLEFWPVDCLALYEHHVTYMLCRISQRYLPEIDGSSFGKDCRKLFQSLKNYKDLTIVLIDVLNRFLQSMVKVDVVEVAKELIGDGSERSFAVIGLSILPGYSEDDVLAEEKLENVIGILESCRDEVVEIYLRRKFGKRRKKNLAGN